MMRARPIRRQHRILVASAQESTQALYAQSRIARNRISDLSSSRGESITYEIIAFDLQCQAFEYWRRTFYALHGFDPLNPEQSK
jgi:hypothetical protein